MRLSRFVLISALAVAAVGCSDDDEVITANIPPLAFVRYINAVPDTLNTTVRWIDAVEFTPQTFVNVPFRAQGQGGYQGLRAGARSFRVFTADVVNFSTAGNTAILVDTTLTFEAGKYYTLLHTGFARSASTPKQRVVLIVDDIPTPGAGNIALRVINAAYGQASADVYVLPTATSPVAGSPAFTALALNSPSAYRTQAIGAFAARATPAGNTTPFASTLAPAGTAGTTAADPIGGSTIDQSVITAILFPASVTGSPAQSFTTPGVGYFIDKQPPRTTP